MLGLVQKMGVGEGLELIWTVKWHHVAGPPSAFYKDHYSHTLTSLRLQMGTQLLWIPLIFIWHEENQAFHLSRFNNTALSTYQNHGCTSVNTAYGTEHQTRPVEDMLCEPRLLILGKGTHLLSGVTSEGPGTCLR